MVKKWKPSIKQLNAYDELLKKKNRTRKKLLRKRQILEQEGEGYKGSLPALIIPERAKIRRDKSYRFDSYADYRAKMNALKRLYGNEEISWFKENYKQNIIDAWLDAIDKTSRELGYMGEELKPQGRFGLFSNEQIQMIRDYYYGDLSELADYMEAFNEMRRMSTVQFMDAYEHNYFVQFRFIYADMRGVTKGNTLDEFIQGMKDYKRDFKRFGRAVASGENSKTYSKQKERRK